MPDNSEISDRITALVQAFSNGNNSHFASLLGVSEANIRGYRTGRMPKFDFIKLLIDKLGVSPDWLISGKGKMHGKQLSSNSISKYAPVEAERRIPIIDIETAAGSGTLNSSYIESLGYFNVPNNSLQSRTATYYVIKSRGDSMFPTIYDNDALIIRELNRSEWEDIRDEYVYVIVDRSGKSYVKRIKNRLSRGFIVLMSDNLDKVNYPNFTLNHDELSYFFYPELKISSHFPNINASYFDRLKQLEDRVDEFDIIFKRLQK